MHEIDRICTANQLTYYLAGGTLIGAARHKGFIPWDDDLDVSMPRADYERFKEICKTQLNQGFVYQDWTTDPTFNLFLAKIRLQDTRLVDQRTKDLDIDQGIYVDVFPLDSAKNKDKKLANRASKFKLLAQLKAVKLGIASPKQKGGALLKALAVIPAKLMPLPLINHMTEAVMRSDVHLDYCVNFCSQYGYKRQTMPKEWFGKGTKVNFEGKLYNAPQKYDKVLQSIYGDYMKIPPVEKQITVHKFIEVDLGQWEDKIKI